jgi:electron transfer flavoprotein beta subunit
MNTSQNAPSGKPIKIAVAVKQVPQTQLAAIDPKRGFILRTGPGRLNPHDAPALEVALRLKDALGAVVEAFTMGPSQAQQTLIEVLGLGLDKAWHFCDPRFAGADSLVTARTLAAALRLKGPFDLVVCGRVTVDGGTGQVGPALSKLLGFPFVGRVASLDQIGPVGLTLTQLYGDEEVKVDLPYPAVVSVLRSGFTLRLPTLRDRLKPKSVSVLTLDDLPDSDEAFYGEKGSPTKIEKSCRPGLTASSLSELSPSEAALTIFKAVKGLD